MPESVQHMPKTHRITVDLLKILNNIQRAIDQVSATESESQTVTSIKDVYTLFQPALNAREVYFIKRLYESHWIYALAYQTDKQSTQYFIITPDSILGSQQHQDCQIGRSLSFYLGVALDIQSPPTINNARDAAIAHYIRCYGQGHETCPTSPKTPPLIQPERESLANQLEKVEKMMHLGTNTRNLKLKLLYLYKAKSALFELVSQLRNSDENTNTIQEIDGITTKYKSLLQNSEYNTLDDETIHLGTIIRQFLIAILASKAWYLKRYQEGEAQLVGQNR